MIRKFFLVLFILGFSTGSVMSQFVIKTSDLFRQPNDNARAGRLNIIQDPSIDTLISRYILVNKNLYDNFGYFGMEGFRIQIFSSSNRNARDESSKVRFEFNDKFPDIISYQLFVAPVFFKIRVGNFRTKTEATKLFLLISKQFPDAYFVRDFISFPDLNKK